MVEKPAGRVDLDKPVGREAQKLMFMLAACAIGPFSRLDAKIQVAMAAGFGITLDELSVASQEYARIMKTFNAENEKALAAYRRAQN